MTILSIGSKLTFALLPWHYAFLFLDLAVRGGVLAETHIPRIYITCFAVHKSTSDMRHVLASVRVLV